MFFKNFICFVTNCYIIHYNNLLQYCQEVFGGERFENGRFARNTHKKGIYANESCYGLAHYTRGSFLLRKRQTQPRHKSFGYFFKLLRKIYRLFNHRKGIRRKIIKFYKKQSPPFKNEGLTFSIRYSLRFRLSKFCL